MNRFLLLLLPVWVSGGCRSLQGPSRGEAEAQHEEGEMTEDPLFFSDEEGLNLDTPASPLEEQDPLETLVEPSGKNSVLVEPESHYNDPWRKRFAERITSYSKRWVRANILQIYQYPKSEAEVIGQLFRGNLVVITGEIDGWAELKSGGYVRSDLLGDYASTFFRDW